MDVTIHDIKFQTKWATDENILERGETKKSYGDRSTGNPQFKWVAKSVLWYMKTMILIKNIFLKRLREIVCDVSKEQY